MNETARQSQVFEQSAELADSCDALHEMISELESRLASVLREQTPSPPDKVKADAPNLVSLAEILYERRIDVNRGVVRLKGIAERLEL
jgi:hypothetical protein